jgi:molybdopterin converting factor small subunit
MEEQRLTVLIFGPQAHAIGAASVVVDEVTFPVSVAEIFQQLAIQHDGLRASIKLSRLAINHEFAGDEDMIQADDEVALIGMISGG